MSDAHAHGGGGGAKKLWVLSGTILSGGLAIVFILYMLGVQFGIGADAASNLHVNFSAFNKTFLNLKLDVNEFIILMFQMVALPIIVIVVLRKIWSGGDGGGHH